MSEFADALAYINANLPSDSYYPKYVRRVGRFSLGAYDSEPTGKIHPGDVWQEDDENPTHATYDGTPGGLLELGDDDIVAIRMRDVE